MTRFSDATVAAVSPWLLRARRLADRHLAEALPDLTARDRKTIVDAMFVNLGRSVVEALLLEDIASDLDRHVHADGLTVMDEALAEGNGVIAITGHIGNWELLAGFFGRKGYPVTVIATPVKGAGLQQLNFDVRRSVSVETIPRDGPGAARAILRTLRRGRILAILMDQNTQGQNVEVPFFGRPAPTPVGPAALSLRTGAPLVDVFIHRESPMRHRISVGRPAVPDFSEAETMGRDAWILETTARLTSRIEREVRARPEEWVWWHRRWSAVDARGESCAGRE